CQVPWSFLSSSRAVTAVGSSAASCPPLTTRTASNQTHATLVVCMSIPFQKACGQAFAAVYEVGCQASSGAFADSLRLARTVRAAALGAVVSLPLSSTAFFSRRRAPRCGPDTSPRSAGVSSARAQRPDYRLSVRDRPRPQAPFTVYALGVRHASIESPPIERTVPFPAHPAAERRPPPHPPGPAPAAPP